MIVGARSTSYALGARFKVFDCHIVYCKYVVCLLLAMYAGICRTLYDAPKLHIIFRIPKYFTSNNNIITLSHAILRFLFSLARFLYWLFPGKEDAPTVVLQSHMDMVCESNDKSFDFDTMPIKTIVDGDWLRADGTTLGARKRTRSLLALARPR